MGPDLTRALEVAVWTDDTKTRIRLQQWSVTLAMYLASAAVMALLTRWGALRGNQVAAWLGFVLAGLGFFFVLLRSRWSTRLADPALTQWQMGFGVLAVLWGYSIAGEVRSAMLFPLMVTLTFGAFSLGWRRMALLTAFALAALGATMLGLHLRRPGLFAPTVDIANFLMAAVMLPSSSVLAVKLGALRWRLQQQRADLIGALERIQVLATCDELTGLANRRHAQDLMNQEAQRTQRGGRPFSIALIDLDHFKRVNDMHGHGVGDEVLRRFAIEARASVRACDIVARWGGEEFLVMMPDTDIQSAQRAIERLRVRMVDVRVRTASNELQFTISAGVAQHVEGEPIANTVSLADRALYGAKEAGRNRVGTQSVVDRMQDRVAAARA